MLHTTDNLIIENISKANDEFLKAFYNEIKGLNKKIVNIINSKGLKIILADKLSDILPSDKNDIEKTQDYHPVDRNITTHGLCFDTINAICIFSNTTSIQNPGTILYHEIGHLLDFYNSWGKEDIMPELSIKEEFIKAYKKDITNHWDKIKNDNRFRLKHYIQSSTPENISQAGLVETFASCFAKINKKQKDIDILGEYFENSVIAARNIYNEFLSKFK